MKAQWLVSFKFRVPKIKPTEMLCTVMATLCHSWYEFLQKLERGARENITLFSLLKNIIMQEPLARKLEGFRHKHLQSRRGKQLMENS